MAARCPYLGLAGNRQQVVLVANPRHRCYVRGQAERVGSGHQAETCLTSSYRRCPRLIVSTEAAEPAPAQPPPAAPPDARPTELAPTPVPDSRYTELRAASAPKKKARRSLTCTELVVMGMGLAILLAFSFVGFVIVYRMQVGPGMGVPSAVAEVQGTGTAEALSTLVPTFTPTPSPSPTLPAVVDAPPTPIPEPALPLPTAVVRTPATSPPTRLVLAAIGVDIPVRPVGVKTHSEGGRTKLVWDDLPDAGAFHHTSAYPGNQGNTVINGHRDIQGAVFRDLDEVQVGDEIVVYVGDKAYPYYVTETLVVPEAFASAAQRAENLRLIGYLPEERLTLVTCTPVGLATHRLLVIARPPAEVVPQMPEAGSDQP